MYYFTFLSTFELFGSSLTSVPIQQPIKVFLVPPCPPNPTPYPQNPLPTQQLKGTPLLKAPQWLSFTPRNPVPWLTKL